MRQIHRLRASRPYLFAAVVQTVTLLLTLIITPAREKAPYLLLTFGVMVSGHWGLRPGLFATLLGAAMGDYFLLPPYDSFVLETPADVIPLLLFCIVGVAISWITNGLQLSRTRLLALNTTLENAQRRTNTILESISDGFITLDRDWRYTYVNAAAAKMLGKRSEELLGMSMWDAWREAASTELGAACRRSMQENTPIEEETFFPDPVSRWFQIRCYPSSEGLTIFLNDVHEHRRAGEALRESEARLSLAVESTEMGTFDYHPQTGRLIWSVAAKRHFGLPADARVDYEAFLRGLHPEDREAVDQEVKRVLQHESGGQYRMEYRTIGLEDGKERWVFARGRVFYDSEGRAVRFIGVTLDVTDRKRAEEHLLQSQKLEGLGLLAGGVAHDFNNLLVGVLGNASLARSMLPANHEAAELMEGVVRSAEQAADLTRQMLAYSGKGRFVMEPVNLSRFIPEIQGLVQPSIDKRIELVFDLEPNLPLVEADRGQLQQVFMNLVLNAAEAIGPANGRISIATSATEVQESQDVSPGSYVALKVSDTGCGMDEATRVRIFDPFFSTKFTGRGLGLAAVAGIVRGHKGGISVTSAPGQGSSFTVLFPAVEATAPSSPAAAHPVSLKGKGTVLVVDDERLVLEVGRRALGDLDLRFCWHRAAGKRSRCSSSGRKMFRWWCWT